MGTERFLKWPAATVLSLVLAGPLAAQKVPMPRWVKLSAASANASRAANAWAQPTTAGVTNTPLRMAHQLGDAAIATRSVFRANSRIMATHRPSTRRPVRVGFRGLGGPGLLLTAARSLDDLGNGRLSTSEAGRSMAQIVASSSAAAVTYVGMMSLAGWVGTASTGTAIASLSGAAYSSAATAWWGGGAIASGGGGMAAGSIALTGGMILVAGAAAYTTYKIWNILDPSEREAMNTLIEGLLNKADLTDASSSRGVALMTEKRYLLEALRRELWWSEERNSSINRPDSEP